MLLNYSSWLSLYLTVPAPRKPSPMLALVFTSSGVQTSGHILNEQIQTPSGVWVNGWGVMGLKFSVRIVCLPGVRVLYEPQTLLVVESEAVFTHFPAVLIEACQLRLDAFDAIGRRGEGNGELIALNGNEYGWREGGELRDGGLSNLKLQLWLWLWLCWILKLMIGMLMKRRR
jgi:hypothetical protein